MAAALWVAPVAGAAPAPAGNDDTATATDPAITLLVFGDSLTAGYGLPRQQSFPSQLQSALAAEGYDVAVVNAGVSGDTAAAGLARLDWTLAGLAEGVPDAAIVELGANDGLRGIDPAVSYANLDEILSRLTRRGIPVLLAGMLAPPNLGREYGEAFRTMYVRLADEHDVVFYPFFLDGVAARPALNQADGIHPNADGVAVIVERILPAVTELLGRVSARHATEPEGSIEAR